MVRINTSFTKIKRLKAFLNYLRYDISKKFLFSQSAADSILKDKIYSLARRLDKNFSIINEVIDYDFIVNISS